MRGGKDTVMNKVKTAGALALALLLGACGVFSGEDPEPLDFSNAPEAPVQQVQVPVAAVDDVEIGRTRDGFVITAVGQAPGIGHSRPRLRPRRDGRPGPDGFLDLDFLVTPPDERFEMPAGPERAREVRADLAVDETFFRGSTGLRVHAFQGGLQIPF